MQKFYKKNISQNQIKSVTKIQKSWKKHINRIKFKKALRQLKRKNFTARQLLTSERTYCQHLKFIIKQVLQPSKKAIDDQELHHILFCNITEIYMLHNVFEYKFSEVMKGYRTHQTEISKCLLELFSQENFCSSYTNYCFNYPKADKIMKLLTQNNSSFKEILKKAGILNSAGLNFQSYMIKPVQRLCKYQIMLVQYFNCMPPFHPDYQGIQKVISIIRGLVESTNQQVQQFLNIQRYKQLKYEYSQLFEKMPQNKQRPRKLIYEYDKGNIKLLNMLKQEQVSISSLIVFNDFIMLIPKGNSGNQSPTNQRKPIAIKILHMRKHQNMKYFKNILQIIDKNKYFTLSFNEQKQRDLLYEIIQTQTNYLVNKQTFFTVDVLGTERRESFFKFFTVYIIEINQNKKITKIYPRFKTLLKVQDILVRKNLFNELNISMLQKQTPNQTLKTKTIEKRKLHIREFLERLINHSKIMTIDQIRQSLDYYQGKPAKKTKSLDEDQIQILLPNWQHTTVHLNSKTSKIKDLKSKISAQLQFIHNSQFQIFQIRNKNYSNRRLMYEDEPVLDIYTQQQSLSINLFSDKIEYMFTRHYYLSPEEELALYKIDFIRLELQLSVIKAQILQYCLQQELMVTFMCLFAMYINLPLEEQKIASFTKQMIGKKNYKVSLKEFRTYYQEVQKIVSSQEDELVTIPFLIIKILSNSRLYQCQQFQVLIHQKCIKSVQKQIPSIQQQQIILGIKLTHIILLTLKQKHLIKSIQYKDIESMQMHPNGIIFKFSTIGCIFRIKTTQGYEINKLITLYRQKNIVRENNIIGNMLMENNGQGEKVVRKISQEGEKMYRLS